MDHELPPPYLSVRTVCDDDDPALFEIEVRVVTEDGWSGTVLTGTAPATFQADAGRLDRWSHDLDGEAVIEFGTVAGFGCARLRFFVADMAGHVFCEAQLSQTIYTERRLSVLLRTEPAGVEWFARHLAAFAEGSGEVVVLPCQEYRA